MGLIKNDVRNAGAYTYQSLVKSICGSVYVNFNYTSNLGP